MDPEAEARALRALAEWARSRTTILVAHRASTLAIADRIAVIDGGRVVEIGTMGELAAAGGRFAVMFGRSCDGTTHG
jgi:ABC-type multidrug transport system fused ATPase/permease subunit